MSTRRTFLKFLGLGTVAAPAAAQGIGDLTMQGQGLTAFPYRSVMGTDDLNVDPDYLKPEAKNQNPINGPLDYARQVLADFLDPDKETRRWMTTDVSALDPDFASFRSVSLSHKLLMQKTRNFKRARDLTETYMRGRIAGIWQ